MNGCGGDLGGPPFEVRCLGKDAGASASATVETVEERNSIVGDNASGMALSNAQSILPCRLPTAEDFRLFILQYVARSFVKPAGKWQNEVVARVRTQLSVRHYDDDFDDN